MTNVIVAPANQAESISFTMTYTIYRACLRISTDNHQPSLVAQSCISLSLTQLEGESEAAGDELSDRSLRSVGMVCPYVANLSFGNINCYN